MGALVYVLGAAAVAAVLFVAGSAKAAPRPVGRGSGPPPPPPPDRQLPEKGAGEGEGINPKDLAGAGGAALVGGLLGGAFGDYYKGSFMDPNRTPTSYGLATPIASAAGAGLGLGLYAGGLSFATGPVGLAFVVVTVVAITDTLGRLAIVEGMIRNAQEEDWAAEWTRRYQRVRAMLELGEVQSAWAYAERSSQEHWSGYTAGVAVQRPDLRYVGLGFTVGFAAPGAIPANIRGWSTKELRDSGADPDLEVDVKAELTRAYQASLEKGDELAAALEPAIPWCFYQLDGTRTRVVTDGAGNPITRAGFLADWAGWAALTPAAEARWKAKATAQALARANERAELVSSGVSAELAADAKRWRAGLKQREADVDDTRSGGGSGATAY